MLKINTSFKIILLLITISFISSCGDNDNIVSDSPTDSNQVISASSYKVTGQMQQMTNTSHGIEFIEWDKGIQMITLDIDTKDFPVSVGGGLIDSTGKFTFTMRGEFYSGYMYDLADSVFPLTKIPNDLLVSSSPVRAYIIVNGERKEIFCRQVKQTLDSVDVEYYWNFYSTEGEMYRYNEDKFDDLLGTYDIRCRKGWNLIEHKISPSEFKSIDVLPDDVIFYIYE